MSDAMHPLLAATPLLDLHHLAIESLVTRRGWRSLPAHDRIGAVYDFVRNEIAFGYNEGDELPASRVLADGIGQCNTKTTLLMALLRSSGIARCFCGYGAATPDLSAPQVEWQGRDTSIQKEGIADDFGVFDSHDAIYARQGSNLSGLRRWLYERVVRHAMNRNVERIRAGGW